MKEKESWIALVVMTIIILPMHCFLMLATFGTEVLFRPTKWVIVKECLIQNGVVKDEKFNRAYIKEKTEGTYTTSSNGLIYKNPEIFKTVIDKQGRNYKISLWEDGERVRGGKLQ